MTEPKLPAVTSYRLSVCEVLAETHDTCSLVLDVPAESGDQFHYRPGQFLTVRVPSDRTGSVARCYSLSSSPYEDKSLKVTVKRVKDGYASNWICDNMRKGQELDVLSPAGVFTPKSMQEDFILLAGGSGITPIMSILKTALHIGTGTVVLIYANRDEESVIFSEELASLARSYPDRFIVMHWLETVQGLPSVVQLRKLASPYGSHEAFICGPTPFMDAAEQALRELDIPRNRIHVERFVSLVSNPFEATDNSDYPNDIADDGEPVSLRVELDGESYKFSWPRRKKLLDFLLEVGIDAPFSCREGACSACACQVERGEVKMLNNEVLDQDDLDEGLALACQAVPVTDDVSIRYE